MGRTRAIPLLLALLLALPACGGHPAAAENTGRPPTAPLDQTAAPASPGTEAQPRPYDGVYPQHAPYGTGIGLAGQRPGLRGMGRNRLVVGVRAF